MVTIKFEGEEYKEIKNSKTERIWLDRNLGAKRVAESSNDEDAYGDYYQWGRTSDGHEKKDSEVYKYPYNSISETDAKLITGVFPIYDCFKPEGQHIWDKEVNLPCPDGFRLPTVEEWEDEMATWENKSSEGAFNSILKIPLAGMRQHFGAMMGEGEWAGLWTQDLMKTRPTMGRYITISTGYAGTGAYYRTCAFPIRFIKKLENEPKPQKIKTVVSKTGRIWMDRNLGAEQVATSLTDEKAYGDLYQWGRPNDGHEKRDSETTKETVKSKTVGHGKYIIGNSKTLYNWNDWNRSSLWNKYQDMVNPKNNPCPPGFRIPTKKEWEEEIATWDSPDANGAFNSVLKLPAAGVKNYRGDLQVVGDFVSLWTCEKAENYKKDKTSYYVEATEYPNSARAYGGQRSYANSVRAIKI